MNLLQVDALSIHKMASGNLCLQLTERVEWEDFPNYVHEFLRVIGGEILEKNDAVDIRLWVVRIGDTKLWLVYEDYPQMVSLEPHEGQACDALLQNLHQKLRAL